MNDVELSLWKAIQDTLLSKKMQVTKQQATCVHTDVRALHLCIDTSRKGPERRVAGSVGRAHYSWSQGYEFHPTLGGEMT